MTTESKPRTLSRGTVIGRALSKLTEINEAEQAELAQSPAAIREKFSGRRQALLEGLAPDIKAAVLAAASTMGPDAAAE